MSMLDVIYAWLVLEWRRYEGKPTTRCAILQSVLASMPNPFPSLWTQDDWAAAKEFFRDCLGDPTAWAAVSSVAHSWQDVFYHYGFPTCSALPEGCTIPILTQQCD